jgi:hypothetical protein
MFQKYLDEAIQNPNHFEELIEEAAVPQEAKTFAEMWSKRLGLSVKITGVKKGKIPDYEWINYTLTAFTKTNIGLGKTTISLHKKPDEDQFYIYSMNGEMRGVFIGYDWDDKGTIGNAKRDIEKTMKNLFPGPRGTSKQQGHAISKQFAKNRKKGLG